jgi:hypothetical protein
MAKTVEQRDSIKKELASGMKLIDELDKVEKPRPETSSLKMAPSQQDKWIRPGSSRERNP